MTNFDQICRCCAVSFSLVTHTMVTGSSGVTGGRGQRLLTRKFLLTYRGKRGKEKREKGWKLRRKERKLFVKGKVEKLQNEERTFFFFFASHFSKPLKFVLGLPNWKFSTRKKHFMQGKKQTNKQTKMTLPPQKYFSVMPLTGSPVRSFDSCSSLEPATRCWRGSIITSHHHCTSVLKQECVCPCCHA